MVNIVYDLYPSGCLKSLRAEGHADAGTKGEDIVCAAVSILIRTALNALRREPRLMVEGIVRREGSAAINVLSCPEDIEEKFRGLTDFLLTGLFDLSAEYPRHVSITFMKR